MLSPRETLLALVLCAIGLLAWWYAGNRDPRAPPPMETRRLPDYTAEQVTGVTMGEDGRPARRLTTPRLRHYPDDDSTELDRPVLLVFADNAPPWRVRAEQGWVSADGDEVLLEGAVHATRAAADALLPVTLRTSELLVLPDVDYAETDRFAELERGTDWVTAEDGMRIWFDEPLRVRTFGRTRALAAEATAEQAEEASPAEAAAEGSPDVAPATSPAPPADD